MLVAIQETDITKYILAGTYDINSYPVYTSWQDADYVTHRDIHRYQVRGRFDMRFPMDGGGAYEAFIQLINSTEAGGTLPISLYVNNRCQEVCVDAYYQMSPVMKRNRNGKSYGIITFEVEER